MVVSFSNNKDMKVYEFKIGGANVRFSNPGDRLNRRARIAQERKVNKKLNKLEKRKLYGE